MVASETLEIKVCLRAKNQLTLPEAMAERLGVGPGDHLILSLDDSEPGMVRIRPVLRSYAGVAASVYHDVEDVAEYLRNERAGWDR